MKYNVNAYIAILANIPCFYNRYIENGEKNHIYAKYTANIALYILTWSVRLSNGALLPLKTTTTLQTDLRTLTKFTKKNYTRR